MRRAADARGAGGQGPGNRHVRRAGRARQRAAEPQPRGRRNAAARRHCRVPAAPALGHHQGGQVCGTGGARGCERNLKDTQTPVPCQGLGKNF